MKALRLANQRVNGALQRLRQIGNLGSPSYDLSEADKARIYNAISSALQEMKQRLEHKTGKPDRFSL